MIHVTETAAAELKRLAALDGIDAPVVRLSVEEGGCSGSQYTMGVAGEPGTGQTVFAHDGLRVAVAPAHLPLLSGMTIDFSRALVGVKPDVAGRPDDYASHLRRLSSGIEILWTTHAPSATSAELLGAVWSTGF